MLQTRFLTGWLDFFSALVHRDFRLFWVGLMAQVTGQQMTIVTLGWLAYYLTESPLALGIINLLSAAPRLVINLLGGVLADRVDPRALIAGAQAISALVLIALGVLAITNNATIWHLAVAAFILGLVQSFDEPSRASLFPASCRIDRSSRPPSPSYPSRGRAPASSRPPSPGSPSQRQAQASASSLRPPAQPPW